jgi:tRNA pseudouridine55 synthase
VRSLAHDIGKELSCGAHLVGLRRTQSGRFTLRDAVPLRRLEEAFRKGEWYRYLIPAAEALTEWPMIELDPDEVEQVRHGHRIKPKDLELTDGQMVRALTEQGDLVAVMIYIAESDELQPKKVFFAS